MLVTVFVLLLKHNMCKGSAQQGNSVSGSVNQAFTVAAGEVEEYYDGLCGADTSSKKSLMECLYYVASWHARTLKKADEMRKDSVRKLICWVFDNVAIQKVEAGVATSPIQKVE